MPLPMNGARSQGHEGHGYLLSSSNPNFKTGSSSWYGCEPRRAATREPLRKIRAVGAAFPTALNMCLVENVPHLRRSVMSLPRSQPCRAGLKFGSGPTGLQSIETLSLLTLWSQVRE
jgi:hypothetical protein